jgi:PAS domain S-box-containing protein
MIWIDLVYNLSLLIALSVVSGFVDMRWKRNTLPGVLLQGVVFGSAAAIGMVRPFVFSQGLIFDGRSVMISLGGLFFGPWTAAVAGLMTIPLRVAQGGPGTVMGVLVILVSAALGVGLHLRRRGKPVEVSSYTLLLFGLAVHLSMLAMALALPTDMIVPVLKRIAWPVMLVYPLATVLIGKILSDQAARARLLETLRKSAERHRAILQTALDGCWLTDMQGRLLEVNEAFCQMTGYSEKELLAMRISDLETCETAEETAAHIQKLREQGEDRFETRHRRKDGSLFDVEISAQYQPEDGGQIVAFLQDITERKRTEQTLRNSENRYRGLVELAVDGILLGSHEGFIIEANQCMCDLSGMTREELIGKDIRDMPFTRDCMDRHPFRFDLLRQGQSVVTERTWARSDGLTVVFEMRTKMMPDGTYQSIYRDITERKRVEGALRESEEKFRVLADSTPTAVMLYQGERWVYANHAAVAICGYSEVELQAMPFWGFVHPDYQSLIKENGQKRLSGDAAPSRFEFKIIAKDGTEKWVDLSGASTTLQGRPSGIISVLDITERKRAETELQNMRKLQSVGTLAGGIAHDFNNILTGLFGNIALAKAELAKAHPGHMFLEEAEKSMNRAVRLTNQLLTFSKGGDPVKEDVQLGALVEEVARFDLSGSNVRLVYRQAEDLWQAEADKGQIQQVVSNITVNALQSMPGGGHLRIALENVNLPEAAMAGPRPGRYVKITVQDEGTGIDPKHLDRIFDPYFTTKQTGHGLGLATAYSIINKHGGHIGVESELGKGTTFALYLPASNAPQPSDKKTPPTPPAATSQPPAHAARILVMDDDAAICRLAVQMLGPCGYSVTTAPGGQEALELYKQALGDGEPFDVVIMDLTIPGGIGGKEAIKNFLAFDPHVRAIVSSGYAVDPVMANYAKYGFKDVAAKPYTPAELHEIVARVLDMAVHSDTPPCTP